MALHSRAPSCPFARLPHILHSCQVTLGYTACLSIIPNQLSCSFFLSFPCPSYLIEYPHRSQVGCGSPLPFPFSSYVSKHYLILYTKPKTRIGIRLLRTGLMLHCNFSTIKAIKRETSKRQGAHAPGGVGRIEGKVQIRTDRKRENRG